MDRVFSPNKEIHCFAGCVQENILPLAIECPPFGLSLRRNRSDSLTKERGRKRRRR